MQYGLVAVAHIHMYEVQWPFLQTCAYSCDNWLQCLVEIIGSKQGGTQALGVLLLLELQYFKQVLQFQVDWLLFLSGNYWILFCWAVSHVGDGADGWALWYKPEEWKTQRRLPAKEFFCFCGLHRFKELAAKCVQTELMDLFPDRLSVEKHPLTMSTTFSDVKEGLQDKHKVLGNEPPDELSQKLLTFKGVREWNMLLFASFLLQPFTTRHLDPCHQLAESKCLCSMEVDELVKIPKECCFVFWRSPQFFWNNFVADTLQESHNLQRMSH